MNKKEKGITLIALVITIIVLLILAGVSIAMLTGENGILGKAKKAKEETNSATEKEESQIELSQVQISKYDGTTNGRMENKKNRTLYGATEGYTYKNPIIPEGFNASDDGAGWYYTDDSLTEVKGWNDGLVIEDASNGNQFVWVPVDGEKVKYEKNSFKGKLVPLSDVSTDTSAYPEGIESEEEEKGKVEKYQGFYVARYEAGNNDAINETSSQGANAQNNVTKAPISKKGTKVWNFVNYSNAKASSKLMVNNNSVKSALITGTQWDTIMKWFTNSGIIVDDVQDWGTFTNIDYQGNGYYYNFPWVNNEGNITQWTQGEFIHKAVDGTTNRYFHASGLNSKNVKKNIIDIGGNFAEFNAEIKISNTQHRIIRGANAYSSSSEGFCTCLRSSNSWSWCYADVSFREALFIN